MGFGCNCLSLIEDYVLHCKQGSYSVSFYVVNAVPSWAKHGVSHAAFSVNHTILQPTIVQAFLPSLLKL